MGLVQRSLHATATGLQHPYAKDADSEGTCTHSKQKLRSAHHFVGESVPEIHSKSSSSNRRLRSSWLPQYSRSWDTQNFLIGPWNCETHEIDIVIFVWYHCHSIDISNWFLHMMDMLSNTCERKFKRIVNDMKNDCGLLRISVASCWHYMSESRNSQCVTAHTFMSTKTSVQRGQKYLGLRQCGISNVSMSGIVSLMLLLKNLMFTSLSFCVCVLSTHTCKNKYRYRNPSWGRQSSERIRDANLITFPS